MNLKPLQGGILLRCGMCLEDTSRGYLLGPKVGHVTKVELEAVLQRGQPAAMCGRPAESWG
jgi:hypothetical protein